MDPNRLKSIPLFEGLSRKHLQELSRWTDEIEVPAGKELTHQGDFGYEFLIIEQGDADVLRDGHRIGALGPGDFFGEIALTESERRTASVIATSPMRLVVMTRHDFKAMEDEIPDVARRVQEKLAERRAHDDRA